MVYSHMQAKYSYTFKIFKLLRKQSEEMSGRMMDTQVLRQTVRICESRKKKKEESKERSREESRGGKRKRSWVAQERRASGWTDRNNKEGQEAGHSCAYL